MLPSHDPNKAFTEASTPFKFNVALPSKMRLDIEQWEVGLVEMFIPDYGCNIKHPRKESLKITYERVIEGKGGISLAKVNTVEYIVQGPKLPCSCLLHTLLRLRALQGSNLCEANSCRYWW